MGVLDLKDSEIDLLLMSLQDKAGFEELREYEIEDEFESKYVFNRTLLINSQRITQLYRFKSP